MKIKPEDETRLLLRLTDYWRKVQVASVLESLKDDRDATGDQESRENIIRGLLSYADFQRGFCPQTVWGRAFNRLDQQREEAHVKALRFNPNAIMPEPAQSISVVFSPYGLQIVGEKDPLYVVFGTATVDREGAMTTADVDSDLPPMWIGRSCLAPTEGLSEGLFPLADADKYYTQIAKKLTQLETWPSDWSLINGVCDEIWKNTVEDKILLYDKLSSNYSVTPGWIRFEEKDSKKLTIIRIYEKLREQIEKETVQPLYREAILGQHRKVFTNKKTDRHLGQMGADYPLAPSQRSSLLAYLQTGTNRITAVNGPPGTGKTTLLQSVVATELVSHAIEQSDAPLYIAGAATNQAVSNIIAAFREATEGLTHPLADRWIPGLGRRYGVYFRGSKGEALNLSKASLVCIPSNFSGHKDYDEDGINKIINDITRKNEDKDEVAIDLFLAIGESEIVRDDFISQASRFLHGHFETLESVKEKLHQRLLDVKNKILTYSHEADSLTELIKRFKLTNLSTYDDALRELKERHRLASERIQQLITKHKIEQMSDNLNERRLRDAEDEDVEKLVKNHNLIENSKSIQEEQEKQSINSKLGAIKEINNRYEGLGPPTSFWSWLSESFFPWAKNAKIAQIRSVLAVAIDSELSNLEANDLFAMRQDIQRILGMGRVLLEKRAQIDQEMLNRKSVFRNEENVLKDFIKKERERRKLSFYERESVRAKARESLEFALDQDLSSYESLRLQFQDYQKTCREILNEDAPKQFDKIDGKIDTTLRVEAFLLATHYWECRFLLEVGKSGWRSQANRQGAFRMIAMLAPCFVSTFDKMGSSFNVMKQNVIHPMWGLADTLIVDEAGQASPDKGAFAFSLAKKAIVVGDNLQLPPVGSNDAGTILKSIAESSGVLNNDYVTSRGLLTGKVGVQKADGSLMRMASAAAYYDMIETTQGMWLRDHFRCDPRIIAFANDIWYIGDTALIPRRVRNKESFVPHFGHVSVLGKTNKNSNKGEAEAIMAWLNFHGEELQRHYGGKPLHEIAAVLTPFTNQKNLLRRTRDKFSWSKSFESPEKIVMGTVHALQGAEREVVIFSTVYDKPKPSYFFDREHTLLNVAVSRAKDSFIVFGNRAIFIKGKSDPSRPSTFLAEYLMNENLPDVPPLPTVNGAPRN